MKVPKILRLEGGKKTKRITLPLDCDIYDELARLKAEFGFHYTEWIRIFLRTNLPAVRAELEAESDPTPPSAA